MEAAEADVQMPTFPLPQETASVERTAETPAVQPPNAAWVYNRASGIAVFGLPNSEGLLTIGCDEGGTLTVTRHTAATEDGKTVLVLTGQNRSASISLEAVETDVGPDHVWQGTVGPAKQSLREVFTENPGVVTVSIGEGTPLSVPASPEPVQAIDACS